MGAGVGSAVDLCPQKDTHHALDSLRANYHHARHRDASHGLSAAAVHRRAQQKSSRDARTAVHSMLQQSRHAGTDRGVNCGTGQQRRQPRKTGKQPDSTQACTPRVPADTGNAHPTSTQCPHSTNQSIKHPPPPAKLHRRPHSHAACMNNPPSTHTHTLFHTHTHPPSAPHYTAAPPAPSPPSLPPSAWPSSARFHSYLPREIDSSASVTSRSSLSSTLSTRP